MLAGIYLDNVRKPATLALGKKVYFFITKVLSFPLNLIKPDLPYQLDKEHDKENPDSDVLKDMDRLAHLKKVLLFFVPTLLLIFLNIGIQIALVYLVLYLI